MARDFSNADLYGEEGAEMFWAKTAEQYIRENYGNKDELGSYVGEFAPITIVAYVRVAVDPNGILPLAFELAELAAENFSDEYGNPDGPDDEEFPTQALAVDLVPVLEKHFANARVWRCIECGRKTYSQQELMDIVEKKDG